MSIEDKPLEDWERELLGPQDDDGRYWHKRFEEALAKVERLTEANDRLARIASQVSVALEEGKRDFMAHGWEVGFSDATWRKGHNSQCEGLDCDCNAGAVNPYRDKSAGLEGLEGL